MVDVVFLAGGVVVLLFGILGLELFYFVVSSPAEIISVEEGLT